MKKGTQINSTRRKILQSTASAAALMSTGWAPLALADTLNDPQNKHSSNALPTCDLTIYQLQTGTRESITVMNQTTESVTLDEIYPIGLSQANGSLLVKVSVPNGPVTIKPGQRLSFSIEATTGNTQWDINDEVLPNLISGHVKAIPNMIAGKIRVRSLHPAFNGVIPVTVFDAIPA